MNRKQASKESAANWWSGHGHELFALLAGVTGLFISLSLFSYHPADGGWTHAVTAVSENGTYNLGGLFGAWVSDLLFFFAGWTSWLIPAVLFWFAARVFLQRHERKELSRLWWLRFWGTVIFLVAVTALVGLGSNPPEKCGQVFEGSLNCGAGGLLGHGLASPAAEIFGLTGARLLFFTLTLLGLSAATGISWLVVVERVGGWTLLLWARAWTLAGIAKERYLSRKNLQLQKKPPRDVIVSRSGQETAISASSIKEEAPTPKQPPVEEIKPPPSISKKTALPPKPKSKTPGNLFETPPVSTLPEVSLLDKIQEGSKSSYTNEELESLSRRLEFKLKEFKIDAEVKAIYPGPVITRFEIQPAAGIKASRITGLAKDLARSLAVSSVRVVEVIPGKSVVGIEIPNEKRSTIALQELLDSPQWKASESHLSLALGQDIAGEPVIVALDTMPHLLIAGTTGAGKSMGINAMILSFLFKSSPQDVRLILVDPKMLELAVYDGIPHLLTPVITNMNEAANGLRWCVAEMERRYKLMAELGVRNLTGCNQRIRASLANKSPLRDPLWEGEEGEAPFLEPLPAIVVVVDEFADLMMMVGKKVEELIARIAQKARAAGIHLILATQRPSVDVITGVIKANIPTRIAYLVSSMVDSRTILDQKGAEQLLGYGDMLYLPTGSSTPIRVHGAYVSDDEVKRTVSEWKSRAEASYLEEVVAGAADGGGGGVPGLSPDEEGDELYDAAVQCVLESRRASASFVQRKLRIGYNRAARLLEMMEEKGVVSPMGSNGNREVLAPPGTE